MTPPKDGWYWVIIEHSTEPEIARAINGSWYDFADDPGAVPHEYVTILRGPLRPPSPTLSALYASKAMTTPSRYQP